MNRPRLLLFDTVCIIEAKSLGVWDELCRQYDVLVPETVVQQEAQRFTTAEGRIIEIDLVGEERAGKIHVYSGLATEISGTLCAWPAEIRDRADPGEVEALTYLRLHDDGTVAFLTADGPAIQAAVALNCGHSARSLHSICTMAGLNAPSARQFSDAFVDDHRQRGLALLLGKTASARASGAPRRKGPKR